MTFGEGLIRKAVKDQKNQETEWKKDPNHPLNVACPECKAKIGIACKLPLWLRFTGTSGLHHYPRVQEAADHGDPS